MSVWDCYTLEDLRRRLKSGDQILDDMARMGDWPFFRRYHFGIDAHPDYVRDRRATIRQIAKRLP